MNCVRAQYNAYGPCVPLVFEVSEKERERGISNLENIAIAHGSSINEIERKLEIAGSGDAISAQERIEELKGCNRNLGARLERKSADLASVLRDLHASCKEADELREKNARRSECIARQDTQLADARKQIKERDS